MSNLVRSQVFRLAQVQSSIPGPAGERSTLVVQQSDVLSGRAQRLRQGHPATSQSYCRPAYGQLLMRKASLRLPGRCAHYSTRLGR